ncbi:hypothetical protein JQC67_00970 [Aurantibacter crassamenti]|uniref:hypothetical protein n=1 Tax=Aurantibacter crassamenti TaxID=1837375 RepID=UPI00193A45FA|nr:hypothetical protein [Aurantibacter crassamenti]MBM1104697.1 hypothetical protein [Aurantibacter crassamenti]
MIKKIGIVIALIAATGVFAQDGSVSPYSYFGIGDLRSQSTYENQMMGSIGMYTDSIHVNLQNPAAYSQLGVQVGDDFGMTTYTAGMSYKQLQLKSFTAQESNQVTNLDYLAIGFSLKKGLGVGFGIMPVSSVGYNLLSVTADSTVTNQYTGSGGLNKAYFSIGWEFAKDLSVGVTANLNFGTLESTRIQSTKDVQLGVQDNRTSRVNGFDFNYALNYSPTFENKHTLFASLRINTQANLTSENTQEVGSFSLTTGSDVETYEVDLDAQVLKNTDLKIPTKTTLGIGYGKKTEWFLGAEYSFQKMSDFSNDFLAIDNLVYNDASSMAIGGFYIPDSGPFTSYWKRVTYRAGLRFDKTGMVVNNKDINNFGITFGFGLPLGRSFSNLNLGFEVGRRGTTAADLIEESYFKLNVGLSLNDLWFRKRKID